MDTRDYSKNYLGEPQAVKTQQITLVDGSGNEILLTGDDLVALLALLTPSP